VGSLLAVLERHLDDLADDLGALMLLVGEAGIGKTRATAGGLLGRRQQVPEAVGRVLVLGHNPGLAELASELVGSGDTDPRHR
jgi:hypothetical protein